MLEQLKEKVFQANLDLVKHNLVIFTWGNVSGYDEESKLVVIKPSGVKYENMKAEDMVIVDLNGNVVEGNLKPSSDTMTHIEVYKNFPTIKGVVHTHSKWATIYSQLRKEIIPYGTTHADYFNRDVPVTRELTKEEIESDYEQNTGKVIVEKFKLKEYNIEHCPAILVYEHGPFTFGTDVDSAVHNAVVLEYVAEMAYYNAIGNNDKPMGSNLLKKHFNRKHGKNSYYGQ